MSDTGSKRQLIKANQTCQIKRVSAPLLHDHIVGENGSTVISLLLLHGTWNNLSDNGSNQLEYLFQHCLEGHPFYATLLTNIQTQILAVQVDESEESMDYCISDNPSSLEVDSKEVEIRSPADLPALLLTCSLSSGDIIKIPLDISHLTLGIFLRGGEKCQSNILNFEVQKATSNALNSLAATLKEFESSTSVLPLRASPQRSSPTVNNTAIRIFVAGDKSQVGKSSICLSLLGTLLQNGIPPSLLAYVKPATQCEETQLVAHYCKNMRIECCPVGPLVYYKGFTRSFLKGEVQGSDYWLNEIQTKVDAIAKGKQVVLIDGVGYPAVGSICGTDNADVAAACGYPSRENELSPTIISSTKYDSNRIPPGVIIVGKRGVGDAIDSYNLNASYFRAKGVPILGAIFNRLPNDDSFYSLENCKAAITQYFQGRTTTQEVTMKKEDPQEQVFGFVPEVKGIRVIDSTQMTQEEVTRIILEDAKKFINAFSSHVDTKGILEHAVELKLSLRKTRMKQEYGTSLYDSVSAVSPPPMKKIKTFHPPDDSTSSSVGGGDKQQVGSNTTPTQPLTTFVSREQIEAAAKRSGAAGG